uniref:Uncharacterized protein LOC108042690 n=1 Tax=Drosophila rhopaloa TaxID=1041015 RepID=A0A6P4ETW1_DRORH
MDKEIQQLIFQSDLDSIVGREFESAFCLDGKPILPPMMTEKKRLEMMRLRLCALTNEVILKRNKLSNPKYLMDTPKVEQKNASTSTKILYGSNGLVVNGRFRQKLVQSETMIYDHTANMVVQISAPMNVPILMTSQLMLEDAPPTPPQRAVIKVTPVKLATSESGWVTKLDPPKSESSQGRELVTEPLQRCTTSPDLYRLHHQLWRRYPVQIPVPQLTLAVKSDSQIGWTEGQKDKLKARVPSRIPKPIPCQVITIPTVCSRPNAPRITKVAKPWTVTQKPRNIDVKVAPKRLNQTKKSEALPAKRKPPAKPINLNVPKSIRTPVAAHKRPGFKENDLQQQKNLLKSLVLRQAEENQRLQAQFREQQQGLIAQMLGDLNKTIEISSDPEFMDRFSELDTSTPSNSSQI